LFFEQQWPNSFHREQRFYADADFDCFNSDDGSAVLDNDYDCYELYFLYGFYEYGCFVDDCACACDEDSNVYGLNVNDISVSGDYDYYVG
jgi:hypothetical protein